MNIDNKGGLENFQENIESVRDAASQIFKTKHLIAAGVLGSLAAVTEPLWSPHFHKTMNIVLTTSLLLGACAPGLTPRPTAEVGSTPDSTETEVNPGMGEAFTKDEALKAMDIWRVFSNGVQNGQMTGTPECVPSAQSPDQLLSFHLARPDGTLDTTISYGFCTAPVTISGGTVGEISQDSAFFLKHDAVTKTTESYILIKANDTDYQVGGLRDGKTYRESFDLRYSVGSNGEDQFSLVRNSIESKLDVHGLPTAAVDTYDVVFKTGGSTIDLTPTAPEPTESSQPGEVGYVETVADYYGLGSAKIEVVSQTEDRTAQLMIDVADNEKYPSANLIDGKDTVVPGLGTFEAKILQSAVVSRAEFDTVDLDGDGSVDGQQAKFTVVYRYQGNAHTADFLVRGVLWTGDIDPIESVAGFLKPGVRVNLNLMSFANGSGTSEDIFNHRQKIFGSDPKWPLIKLGSAGFGNPKVTSSEMQAAVAAGTLNVDSEGIICDNIFLAQ